LVSVNFLFGPTKTNWTYLKLIYSKIIVYNFLFKGLLICFLEILWSANFFFMFCGPQAEKNWETLFLEPSVNPIKKSSFKKLSLIKSSLKKLSLKKSSLRKLSLIKSSLIKSSLKKSSLKKSSLKKSSLKKSSLRKLSSIKSS
jgi:hypothetical protein